MVGLNFVLEDIQTEERLKDCPRGFVVNMSFGGAKHEYTNWLTKSLVDAGVFVAVAAGNEEKDAAESSPASEPSACTVGASDKDDKIAGFSNFGGDVDIYAPGVDIESTKPGGGTKNMQGTSMASPLVAGIGAMLLGAGVPSKDLCSYVASHSYINALKDQPAGTIGIIASNGFGVREEDKCKISLEYVKGWNEHALRRHRVTYDAHLGNQGEFAKDDAEKFFCGFTKNCKFPSSRLPLSSMRSKF